MQIALIGASGFIGLRMTEMLHLGNIAEVRPVVRSASSLAVLSRMRLDWRICDILAETTLAPALKGCEVCVHAAIGDAGQIVRMAKAAYVACAMAGVRRLVWLSSASVYGQNPAPGTDETTPLHDHHPLIYNNAKVRADRALDELARDGRVEVIKLRPSVVFGPRSRWIANPAEDLLEGRAVWLSGGRGICNTVYVDNLVEAIRLAATVPGIAGQSFLVSDAETVTWREFLLPIAARLGLGEEAFTQVGAPGLVYEQENHLAALTLSPIYGRMMGHVPDRAKRIVKGLVRALPQPSPAPNAWSMRPVPKSRMTQEVSLLQQCQWKLPNAKAEGLLGYRPLISFEEGLKRSLAWLKFAGYPLSPL